MLTEKSFDTGEVAINFAEGEETGKPLVFLHGSSHNWQTLNDFLPSLAKNWHIYAPDLRGHGKSGKAKSGYLYDNFFPDITAFIEQQVGRPVVLAGFSLGASIALGIAAHRPELVRALILLEPPLFSFRDTGLQSFAEPYEWYTWLNQTLTSARSFEEVVARCKERAPDSDEASLLNFAQRVHNLDPQTITTMIHNQTFKGYKPEQLLPQLVCPTLLVYGERKLDSVINDDDVELFKKYAPQGIAVHVKDVGHGVIWGSSGQAALEHVDEFLNSL